MESVTPGELVKVTGTGAALDGIVFDTPSSSKVVVAVVDPVRGPVFRSVNQSAISERTDEGHHDRALRALIRRTPPPVSGAARGGVAGGRGRSGFKQGTMHRTTGR